ncbi:hypothetical protein NY547_18055 [Cnuibacter physcomitrellae]|nr:hypothetical protein [Cnuibacter physcomitrellae]MCS5499151.1 hypothetical protein [Cnuibacter physcomitrellae]
MSTARSRRETPSLSRHASRSAGSGPASISAKRPALRTTSASPWPMSHAATTQSPGIETERATVRPTPIATAASTMTREPESSTTPSRGRRVRRTAPTRAAAQQNATSGATTAGLPSGRITAPGSDANVRATAAIQAEPSHGSHPATAARGGASGARTQTIDPVIVVNAAAGSARRFAGTA